MKNYEVKEVVNHWELIGLQKAVNLQPKEGKSPLFCFPI